MFCEKCGTKMPEKSRFCPECGAPAAAAAQPAQPPAASPQPQVQAEPPQVDSNTAPMPPVPPAQQPPQPAQPPVPPPPAAGFSPQGGVQPAGGSKNLALGIGIAALVLLLAGGGFAARHFGWLGKDDITMEAAAKQEAEEVADPIRASIPMGTGNVNRKLDEKLTEKFLRIIQGDWYDSKGRKLVTVGDMQINDCKIEGIYDLAGGGGLAGGTFRLQENGQEWDVRLDWNISKSDLDSLSVNGNQTLHRTANAAADLETVGGVCLGMMPEQVEQKLGKPSSNLGKDNAVTAGDYTFSKGWYYPDKGLIIVFGNGSVEGIALLKSSKLRFEKSGLNCQSSLEEYAKAYGLQKTPQLPKNRYMSSQASIGNGQTLYFGMDMEYVLLSIYAT